jgi:hypothetical protein
VNNPHDVKDEPNVFKPQWPEGLDQGGIYEVLCDDKGRNGQTWLRVIIANDSDVHVSMQEWEDGYERPSPFPSIRVRTFAGGRRNHRTRQALLWLADAIRRDNEEQGRTN